MVLAPVIILEVLILKDLSDGSWIKSCPMDVRLMKLFHGANRSWID